MDPVDGQRLGGRCGHQSLAHDPESCVSRCESSMVTNAAASVGIAVLLLGHELLAVALDSEVVSVTAYCGDAHGRERRAAATGVSGAEGSSQCRSVSLRCGC